MAKNIPIQPPAGTTLGDVIYVLAKHKWKIILPTLVALAGAAAYYLKAPVLYESNAQLMVRYVLNRNAVDNVDSTNTPGATRGVDAVMISQIAILHSRDLARSVVDLLQGKKAATDSPDEKSIIEPDPKLLALISPDSTPATLEVDATNIIVSQITANAGVGNILDVRFKHADPIVASRVLDLVLRQYLEKHLSIYRSKAAAADILLEVQRSEGTLKRTEGDLLKLRAEKEILTLEGAIVGLNAELVEARGQLGDAESRLAEQQARVSALTGARPAPTPGVAESVDTSQPLPEPDDSAPPSASPIVTAPATAVQSATAAPGATTAQNATAAQNATPSGLHPLVSNGTATRYQAVLSRLQAYRAENVALLAKYTPDSEAVRLSNAQIAILEQQQSTLERQHPELPALVRGSTPGGGPAVDLVSEEAALRAAEVRKLKLENRIAQLEQKRTNLIQDAPAIRSAERNMEINEENHKYLMTSKKKAELDQKLSSDNIPNIDIIQAASPGIQDVKKRDKIALGIAGGGPALAAGLVLFFGLLVNRTIKRPSEFEEKLGFPLMVAIPYFRKLSKSSPVPQLNGPEAKKQLTEGNPSTPPWDPGHYIRPHAEAIRDRLGLFFEVNGIDHKPKLIAVTGQTPGAGASTVASGIAAALSETGDGKVLLVDMGGTNGAAHPFFHGRPAPSLSNAIRSSRGSDEAAENLFLAKADGSPAGNGSSIGASRLSRLMPDLKASYFDYIIFDMPALGNTSPTPAMAAFMDQILIVVEAETSTREEILRQHRDLTEHHARVSTVFNKVRPHGPRSLMGSL